MTSQAATRGIGLLISTRVGTQQFAPFFIMMIYLHRVLDSHRGAGLAEIARPPSILVVFAVGFFLLAVRQYRKRTA